MNDAAVIALAQDALMTTLLVAAPILVVSLVIGMLVSVFQAMTQINEVTLTFVPKILVIFMALLILLPFMLSSLSTFTERLMDRIVSLG